MTKEVKVTKIFCDGSGFNNIDSAYCVIICGWKKKKVAGKVVAKDKKIVKVLNENKDVYHIEYLALIEALKFCESHKSKGRKFEIYSDSLCIVEEINLMTYKKNLGELFEKARSIMDTHPNIRVSWISREQNPAGKYLEQRLKRLHAYRSNTCRFK